MKSEYQIKLIEENDFDACLGIYAPYVADTIISFEYEVPSLQEFTERIKAITAIYPWLVCKHGAKVIGYAYASEHRSRKAYQWSLECTVYILPEYHRKGIARQLYKALFSILRLQGFYNVYAGIGLPNVQSVGFHQALGFEPVGVYKNTGYKHGQWRDTLWMQLALLEPKPEPEDPKGIKEVTGVNEFEQILLS